MALRTPDQMGFVPDLIRSSRWPQFPFFKKRRKMALATGVEIDAEERGSKLMHPFYGKHFRKKRREKRPMCRANNGKSKGPMGRAH
jgi:hypothetical protein